MIPSYSLTILKLAAVVALVAVLMAVYYGFKKRWAKMALHIGYAAMIAFGPSFVAKLVSGIMSVGFSASVAISGVDAMTMAFLLFFFAQGMSGKGARKVFFWILFALIFAWWGWEKIGLPITNTPLF
ncbi:MAG TPA: hypothetical protein VJJ72_03155 [Candidatus Paceibacterota bacterium]